MSSLVLLSSKLWTNKVVLSLELEKVVVVEVVAPRVRESVLWRTDGCRSLVGWAEIATCSDTRIVVQK